MEYDIKPCPFCGSDNAYLTQNSSRYNKYVYVKCETCGASSKSFSCEVYPSHTDWDTMECQQAVEAWNTRQLPCKEDTLDAIRKALERIGDFLRVM